MEFGTRLQNLRKELNYSQKDFAIFLGIPQPSLSEYENQKNLPTLEILLNIATKCNVSLDWLCEHTSNTPKNSEVTDLINRLHKVMKINNNEQLYKEQVFGEEDAEDTEDSEYLDFVGFAIRVYAAFETYDMFTHLHKKFKEQEEVVYDRRKTSLSS